MTVGALGELNRLVYNYKKIRKAFNALNGRVILLIIVGNQRIAGFNPSAINRALGLR